MLLAGFIKRKEMKRNSCCGITALAVAAVAAEDTLLWLQLL